MTDTETPGGVNIYERPHIGMLHSAIYHLWRSLPREVRGLRTYNVMGLICGVDIEEHRSFLRHQLANRWLELDALEEQLRELHARRRATLQAWKDAQLRVDFAESFAYLHTPEN